MRWNIALEVLDGVILDKKYLVIFLFYLIHHLGGIKTTSVRK
jgi:hypothetical protein